MRGVIADKFTRETKTFNSRGAWTIERYLKARVIIAVVAGLALAAGTADARRHCGNGVIEKGEQCDQNNLNGQSCESVGFADGTLSCGANCQFDTSQCITALQICEASLAACEAATCGNGVAEFGEKCDGENLQGHTCQTQGFNSGTLSCSGSCTFDTSNCRDSVPDGMCIDPDDQSLRPIASPVIGGLVITEFMANPGTSVATDDAGKEWFEVLVTASCDLNGVVMRRRTTTEAIPTGNDCLEVDAGTRLIFSNGIAGSSGLPRVDYGFTFALDQTGSCLTSVPLALEIDGIEIDHVCYGTAPTAASRTLMGSKTNTTDNDAESSYCTSISLYDGTNSGTPGEHPDPNCP